MSLTQIDRHRDEGYLRSDLGSIGRDISLNISASADVFDAEKSKISDVDLIDGDVCPNIE